MPPATVATISVIFTVLALAVREDALRHRIPNELSASAFVSGLVLALVYGGASACLYSIAGAAVGLVALLPLYLLRGMGAGDVKLMGAIGAFLGPGGALVAVAATLIAGGVLAVAIVVWRFIEPASPVELSSAVVSAKRHPLETVLIVRKERFPYAVAIAVGVTVAVWLKGWLTPLFAAFGLA
jgi:prepilin peptidase CpaA